MTQMVDEHAADPGEWWEGGGDEVQWKEELHLQAMEQVLEMRCQDQEHPVKVDDEVPPLPRYTSLHTHAQRHTHTRTRTHVCKNVRTYSQPTEVKVCSLHICSSWDSTSCKSTRAHRVYQILFPPTRYLNPSYTTRYRLLVLGEAPRGREC